MQNENANQNASVNITPYRLLIIAGIVYIIFGLLELGNYFYQKPINFLKIFFWISIGIGLFEKHAWSRTLCIIASGAILIVALISGVLLLIGQASMQAPITGLTGILLLIALIVAHSLLLYVLLRKDVKKIFSKEIKNI